MIYFYLIELIMHMLIIYIRSRIRSYAAPRLCGKVDALSSEPSLLRGELQGLGKGLAALAERLEQLERGDVTATPSAGGESRPRAPSPRRWLQEPLFMAVGRRHEVPGSSAMGWTRGFL